MIIFYLNPFKIEENFLGGWGGGRVKMVQNVLHNSWTAPVIEIGIFLKNLISMYKWLSMVMGFYGPLC